MISALLASIIVMGPISLLLYYVYKFTMGNCHYNYIPHRIYYARLENGYLKACSKCKYREVISEDQFFEELMISYQEKIKKDI